MTQLVVRFCDERKQNKHLKFNLINLVTTQTVTHCKSRQLPFTVVMIVDRIEIPNNMLNQYWSVTLRRFGARFFFFLRMDASSE